MSIGSRSLCSCSPFQSRSREARSFVGVRMSVAFMGPRRLCHLFGPPPYEPLADSRICLSRTMSVVTSKPFLAVNAIVFSLAIYWKSPISTMKLNIVHQASVSR